MNLGEISDTIRSLSANQTTNDLDKMIVQDVNRAYRKLARVRTWGALIVRGEQIATVAGTMSYALPYPLDRIINDSLRYDVTATMPGTVIELRNSGDVTRTIASACIPNGYFPITASLGSGGVSALYSAGTVTGGALFNDFFISGGSFSQSHVGKYIRFGTDSTGRNPGDYGYKIIDEDGGTMILLGTQYRGLDLTSASFEIVPSNSQWLTFDPAFTDTAKVIQFDWYSKPARLFNPMDVPEVPELSDAIVYQVLADNPLYHRPQSYDRLNYVQIAREEMMLAIKAGLQ